MILTPLTPISEIYSFRVNLSRQSCYPINIEYGFSGPSLPRLVTRDPLPYLWEQVEVELVRLRVVKVLDTHLVEVDQLISILKRV